MKTPKFKYKDNAVITDGFYKGQVGTILQAYDTGIVDNDWEYFLKLKETGVWVKEELLRLKEE